MDPPNPQNPDLIPHNQPNAAGGPPSQPNHSTSIAQTNQTVPASATPWASQTTTNTASNMGGPSFPQFSAATAEILKRLQANQGNAAGSAAFEAKRAEVLQNYVTSDKLPTPPPVVGNGRRGRGGRVSTPSALKTEGSATTSPATRGSARGRGRGRGGGKAGKRKRNESEESDVCDTQLHLLVY